LSQAVGVVRHGGHEAEVVSARLSLSSRRYCLYSIATPFHAMTRCGYAYFISSTRSDPRSDADTARIAHVTAEGGAIRGGCRRCPRDARDIGYLQGLPNIPKHAPTRNGLALTPHKRVPFCAVHGARFNTTRELWSEIIAALADVQTRGTSMPKTSLG
jgi:hypothetical protein